MLIVDFCTMYDKDIVIPYQFKMDLKDIDKKKIIDIRYYAKKYNKYKLKDDKPSLIVTKINEVYKEKIPFIISDDYNLTGRVKVIYTNKKWYPTCTFGFNTNINPRIN